MTNSIFQIAIAVAIFLILIFALLRYVKPRGNQTEFIVSLLNKLSEKSEPEDKDICCKKGKY